MKKPLALLTAAMLVCLLGGCWQEEMPDEEERGSLMLPGEETETRPASNLPENLSLPYAPDQTLDPITCPDGMQQTAASLVCEGLFRLDGQWNVENVLCADYTYDENTYTYSFSLADVSFSDGTALSAADVKATLDRARTSERYQARLSQVTGVTVRDGNVLVRLSGPNTGFPALLDIPIVKSGTHGGLPVGTGPYVFSREEGGLTLRANPLWRKGNAQPVERIALVEAADQETMRYRFTSREVQLITADLTGTTPMTAVGSVSYQDVDTTVMQYVGCNVSRAPLDNAAFRAALGEGIQREQLVGGFLSGHGTAAQFPVHPRSALYPQGLERAYSREAFALALAQSGVTADRTLTLLVNQENSFKLSAAEALASAWTEAGAATEVRALPWEEYTAALAAGDFDLYYGETRLTADWDLSALLRTGGALNYGGWADETMETLLDDFAAASDRKAAMEAVCRRLQETAPILPVCFKSSSVLTWAEVLEGLTPTAAEPFRGLESCTVHLRETG